MHIFQAHNQILWHTVPKDPLTRQSNSKYHIFHAISCPSMCDTMRCPMPLIHNTKKHNIHHITTCAPRRPDGLMPCRRDTRLGVTIYARALISDVVFVCVVSPIYLAKPTSPYGFISNHFNPGTRGLKCWRPRRACRALGMRGMMMGWCIKIAKEARKMEETHAKT